MAYEEFFCGYLFKVFKCSVSEVVYFACFGYVFVIVVEGTVSFDFSICYILSQVDNSIGKGMYYIV